MHLPTLIVVADDVTGAADSAARCRNAGLTAIIDLGTGHATGSRSYAADSLVPGGVLALSTDSRFLAPQQAAIQVREMITPLAADRDPGAVQWYKKIDSTLRGNLGSEIEAMLALSTPPDLTPCAVIAPAFPAQQRTLVDGYLNYAGLPPRTVHLPTLLMEQSTLPVSAIPLATIRAGGNLLLQALKDAYQAQKSLLVADAETEEDLQRILSAATNVIPHALYCGSAGLVGVLAQQMALPFAGELDSAIVSSHHVTHPILAIVGSGSLMAHKQLAYVRTQRDILVVEVNPTAITLDAAAAAEFVREFSQQLPQQLSQQLTHSNDDIVLHLPQPQPDVLLEGKTARTYAKTLAMVAQAAIITMRPPTLVLVGGDTAVQTLTKLGVRQLTVQTELLPGMPLTKAEDQHGQPYQIVLKAGNHGEPTTLAVLMGREHQSS